MSKVFSSKDVDVIVDEVVCSGFSDNSMVKIDYQVDQTELERGLDGEACFLIIHDDSGTIEISVKGYSQTGRLLQSVYDRCRANKKSFHIAVRDRNGGANPYKAEGQAMPARPPARDYGKGPGDVVWKYFVEHLKVSGGGVEG
jgi:hypothetical protein